MNVTVYDDAALRYGDQVTVPISVWQSLDEEHTDTGPIYIRLTCNGASVYGRVRIALTTEGIDEETCRVPIWMWLYLGAPLPGEGWATLEPIPHMPVVHAITLRPRTEASLTALDDPVTTLSTEISASWSCVMQGSELVLPCGTFDIMALQDASGTDIQAGTVLNTDVNLELLPALDYKPSRKPTPIPSPLLPVFPDGELDAIQHLPPAPTSTPITTPVIRGAAGFIPFSGAGYRLGNK